jgi:hypothetical protein
MFPVRCVTYVPGLYQAVPNKSLQPTRHKRARGRAAELHR